MIKTEYLAEEAIPFPEALISSSRAIGYNLQTAMSDIIDNSISAGAKEIDIQWNWQGEDSWIAVCDDGHGMNLDELVSALRLGSSDPNENRAPADLGRFGLGLKTASFSQCKSLTVLTKKAGYAPITRTWDLDLVRKMKRWVLTSQEPDVEFFEEYKKCLDERGCGTMVLWTKLDRILGKKRTYKEQDRVEFISNLKDVVDHLGIIFHRFLEAPGTQRVKMSMNSVPVVPFDPSMSNTGTRRRLLERRELLDGAVTIQGMTIPYFSSLSPIEHRTLQSGNWYDMQGFYVYRGNRLLVAGDWLRMFRKTEASKHARIFVDLSNSEDHRWRIDVKKSMAIPPADVSGTLRQAALEARTASELMFGKRQVKDPSIKDELLNDIPLWKLGKSRGGGLIPELNFNHPLVELCVSSPSRSRLKYLLRMVGTELPVHELVAANEKDPDKFLSEIQSEIKTEDIEIAKAMTQQLISAGKSRAWAISRVVSLEVFVGKRTQLRAELEADSNSSKAH